MKFGKIEIHPVDFLFVIFAFIVVIILICSSKIEIEKEKTKQMQIMYEKNVVLIPEKKQKNSGIKKI